MRVGRVNATRPAARRLFATPFNTADEPVGVPMAVDATPSPGRGGARSPPALPASGSIPSTTENFRNVRPLQTAFTSNGLVSKRRRGVSENKLLDDSQLPSMSSSGTLRANTSLGSPPSGLPSRNSFGNALPLRDVVQAAQANVAFQSGHRRHPATMPDTPMKPSPSMADTSTKVRSHRRGTSMGGPFPSRAPLFGTPGNTAMPQSATAPRMQHTALPAAPHTHGGSAPPRRHMRSSSDVIRAVPAPPLFTEPPAPPAPIPPPQPEPQEPPPRPEQPVRRSRTRGKPAGRPHALRAQARSAAAASPLVPAMNSPNNCFAATPVQPPPITLTAPGTSGAALPTSYSATGPSFGTPPAPRERRSSMSSPTDVPPSPALLRGERTMLGGDEPAPFTPTRNPSQIKWFEAAHVLTPPSPSARKQRTAQHHATRPRHSEPLHAQALATPTATGAPAPAVRSEPAAARMRASRLQQFEAHFTVEGVLGHGEFSEVVKARDRRTGNLSAVKRMKRPFLGPKDRLRRLEEVDAMRLLMDERAACPSLFGANAVVDLIDAWEEDNYLFVQTELCPLGSLAFVLAEYGRQVGALDEARLWKILAELTAGVEFMHHCGVLHLDLKPANVLITEIGSLKITDFGMATRWPRCSAREILAGARVARMQYAASDSASDTSNSPPSSPALGSGEMDDDEALLERPRRRGRAPRRSEVPSLEREGDREYIAPEVMFEGKYGRPADIFSLGLILLEAACSVEIPDNGEPWHKLRQDDFSDVDLEALSPAMQRMITSMLSSRPEYRPSAADLHASPALVAVREIMARGLHASELHQLPAFHGRVETDDLESLTPYPVPSSRYYEPPPSSEASGEDRKVVKLRGALIQEDLPAFLAEVLAAVDAAASPDTSASLMTDDVPPSSAPVCSELPGAPYMLSPYYPEPQQGMDLDQTSLGKPDEEEVFWS